MNIINNFRKMDNGSINNNMAKIIAGNKNISHTDVTNSDFKIIETTNLETIIVSSLDRDWYNNSNSSPFVFNVSLGGVNNTSHAVINNEYKSIKSIEILGIILSNRYIRTYKKDDYEAQLNGGMHHYNYHSNITVRPTSFPYLLVNIDNIDKVTRGTNKFLDNSMGVFTSLVPLSLATSTVQQLEFKNTSFAKKIYSPTLTALNDLDLSITDSNGNSIDCNDVLGVKGIYINNSNTSTLSRNDYLIIETKQYFDPDSFAISDLIQLNRFQYHDMSFEESYQFNNFINRKSGHNIINYNRSIGTEHLYNQIHIQMPAYHSFETGNFVVENWFTSFITKSLSNTLVNCTSGKLINSNRQTQIIFKIKNNDYSVVA